MNLHDHILAPLEFGVVLGTIIIAITLASKVFGGW